MCVLFLKLFSIKSLMFCIISPFLDILELKQQTTLHQPDIYAGMPPLHIVLIRKN